jgi:hypothetical protein
MALELSLDASNLQNVFRDFPAIFRRSKITDQNTGEHYYALQARYALRKGTDIDEREKVIDVPPLTADQLKLVLDFVVGMAEAERVTDRTFWSGLVSVAAAVIAAGVAVFASIYGAHATREAADSAAAAAAHVTARPDAPSPRPSSARR